MKQNYSFVFITAAGVIALTVLLWMIGTGKYDEWTSHIKSVQETISIQPMQTASDTSDTLGEDETDVTADRETEALSDEERMTGTLRHAYENVADTIEEFLPGVVCIGTKENLMRKDEAVTYPLVLESSINQYISDSFDLNTLIDEAYEGILQEEHLNLWIPVETVIWGEENPYADYLPIIGIWNVGDDDAEALIEEQTEILSEQTAQNERFLILGSWGQEEKKQNEMEERMMEEYGERFINVRAYMSAQNYSGAEGGDIPENLMEDETHLNQKGYELLGHLIYERMWDLGYFDEMNESFQVNVSR